MHFIFDNSDLEKLKKIFQKLYKNGDGRLQYNELRQGFNEVSGQEFSEAKLNFIIADIDHDNEGS